MEWSYVFTMIFMTMLLVFFWRALKVMPKTKPQQINPSPRSR